MSKLTSKFLIIGLIGLLCLPLMGPATPAVAAPESQSADPYYVIQLVNALRAEYGLPPYTVNPQLMAAAQAHTEWAASMGTHSHTGLGGSTPTDRAIAAGYGAGLGVRVSENIYWGTNATAQSAVTWWRNSPIHFRGMTSTNYTEIGAGVAYGSAGGFFTLMFGSVGGATSAPPSSSASSGSSSTKPLPVYVFEEVEVADPREDGSVVHVVGEGQNLSYISEAYDVPVSEIMALNRLTEDSILQPGDELIIVPAPVQPVEETTNEGPIVHTVEEGQTLFGIALRYGVPLNEVLELNGLTENSTIWPGDQITIKPDPNATPIPRQPLYHTVSEGQTLVGIAINYGTDLDTLLRLNNMSPTDIIRPGDKLLIRPGDPTPTPTPTATPVVTATPRPTASPTPNAQRTEVAQATQVAQATATAEALAAEKRTSGRPMLIGAVVLLGLAGAGLVVAGIVMNPRKPPDNPDES